MALLHSLELIGIRNFSPDEKQTIYFNKPVVLFQGPNGSGKTTILESIRYALTGELPGGTTSGQGFVNDPKILGKPRTKGSVKIKFFDAQGNTITVSKVIQVQMQINGNLQFKKLNCTVRRKDKVTEEIHDISSRCADIDSYCCSILNVSKSIFNNVLFCHQENSLWPLDEPKKLKEKFDEIFDAVKYKKCIENIRDLVKRKQEAGKVLKERLQHKADIKKNADNLRSKFETKKSKLKEVTQAIETKKSEIQPLKKRLVEILELEEALSKLQRKLAAKEEEKRGLINQQNTLKKSISYIFEGSDEELEAKKISFKDTQKLEEKNISELEKKIYAIKNEMTSLNKHVQDVQVSIGKLKGEQNQERKVSEDSMKEIDKLRNELNIEKSDDKNFLINEISNVIKSKQNEFSQLKQQRMLEEKKLQDEIDKIREETARTKQSITSKNIAINEYRNKINIIQSKLEELDSSDTQLKMVTNRINNHEETLKKIKNSFNEQEKIEEIDGFKDDINKKEQYLDKLEKEYRVLQKNYVNEQKIESEQLTIIQKESQINKIKSKHAENLKILLNDDVPEKNLGRVISKILGEQELKCKNLISNIDSLKEELTKLNTTYSYHKTKLNGDKKELQSNKKKVDDLCKGKHFNQFLEETYQKKEKLQKTKGYLNAAKIVYTKFADSLNETKCCPVCQSDFKNNASAIPEKIRYLNEKVVDVPRQLVEIETSLKQEEKLYNDLQQLKKVYEDIEMMEKTNIPKLEQEMSNLNQKINEKSKELEAEKCSLEKPKQLIEICKNLIKDATLYDQYQNDIMEANAIITELQENLETVPSNRSRQETEMEIDLVKKKLSNLKNSFETSKNLLDQYKERCQDLNKKIQVETLKQIEIQKAVQEKPLLTKQNSEYKEEIKNLKDEVEELNLVLATQENDLKMAVQNKNNFTKVNTESEDQKQQKLNSFQNSLSKIKELEVKLKYYEQEKTDIKLDKALERLTELHMKIQEREKIKSEASNSISQKKESLAKNESELRAINDNIILREKQKVEQEVDLEINELKQKIGGYNYRQVFEEKERTNCLKENKQREINVLQGQLDELQEQYDEIKFDLNKPEYKNAYSNYKKQYYEELINNKCISDLMKYATVLERSILKFHEERMVQINRSIRSLWRSIYRGNDIDYIEIKTDDNTEKKGSTRRNYNYKVVQIKNETELEMRGRCSAGQKVLACLVIRMALAETFSSHCGILALDEPTTNLDKANISSLCDALSNLIEKRENESNFQLLVITHDEEFLRNLIQVQNIDNYWQVKRSHEGCSMVEKKML